MTNNNDVAAAEEAKELEELLKKVGTDLAKTCASKHLVPQLVQSARDGYWAA